MTTQSLDDWLDEDGPVLVEGYHAAGFHIRDDGAADWAMRRVKKAQEAIAEAEAEAQMWRDKIEAWLTARTNADRRTVEFMEGHLTAYHRRLYDDAVARGDKPPTTYPLPSGKLTSRAGTPRIEVTDPDTLTLYLQLSGHPECLETKPKSIEVKQAFGQHWGEPDETGESVAQLVDDASGELLPGVRLVRPPRTFSVKPS